MFVFVLITNIDDGKLINPSRIANLLKFFWTKNMEKQGLWQPVYVLVLTLLRLTAIFFSMLSVCREMICGDFYNESKTLFFLF